MDDTASLTHLEARVLAAIERHVRSEGVAPTIAELAADLRLKSKGTVHRYVQSLIAKGRLERQGNGWRGLRIVGLDIPGNRSNVHPFPLRRKSDRTAGPGGGPVDGTSAGAVVSDVRTLTARSGGGSESSRLGLPAPPTVPRLTTGAGGARDDGAWADGVADDPRADSPPADRPRADGNVGDPHELPVELPGDAGYTVGDFRIPLLGRIAAGLPIEAIEDQHYLDLAAFFIGPDRYALRVSGESMVDAGILDGDTVILRKQETARTGDIVVALIDGQEATLKRLGDVRDGMVELIPENTSMQPLRYAAARVSFQGVLVGQLRNY